MPLLTLVCKPIMTIYEDIFEITKKQYLYPSFTDEELRWKENE